MITIKPYCFKRKTKKGYPVYIYFNIYGNKNYYPLKKYVEAGQFDNNAGKVINRPDAFRLNHLITEKIAKVNRIIIDLESQDREISFDKIVELLESNNPNSFIQYCRHCLKRDKSTISYKTYTGYKYGIDYLEKYNPLLTFSQIDNRFLKDYAGWLKSKKIKSKNTLYQIFAPLRKYVKYALSEGLIKRYPFDEFKLKRQDGDKDFLTEEERNKLYDSLFSGQIDKWIKDGELKPRTKKTLGNYLLTTFTGIALDDMKRGTERISFTDTHILYTRGKTSTPIKIPVVKKAERLISFVKENKVSTVTSRVHEDLSEIMRVSGIKKHITYHSGRNTFAVIALMKGVNIRAVQKVLGHKSVSTTEKYQRIVDDFVSSEISKLDL